MTRVYCELFAESIEGVVIARDGSYVAEADLDFDSSFLVLCDDGERFIIHGWMVDVQILPPETVH
jgi:hypothetical protein